MKLFNFALILAFVTGTSALANDNNWGLISGQYTVGASKTVAKDFGTLEVHLSLSCVDQADQIDGLIGELVNTVSSLVQDSSEFSLVNMKPKVQIGSQARYQVAYSKEDPNHLSPFFVDKCKNDEKVIDFNGLDLTKKTFTASTSVKVETKKDLASLTVLRQQLELFAKDYNKANKHQKMSVSKEKHVVSEEKQEAVYSELAQQSALLKKTTRMSVDKEVSGGFEELYITSTQTTKNSQPPHKSYPPVLTEDGQSKLTVPYSFTVSFEPKNLGQKRRANYPEDKKGQLVLQYNGEAVVNTDYYIAQLYVSTGCQASEKAAAEAVVEQFDAFKAKAKAVISPADDNPFERLEEVIGRPSLDNKWQTWQKAKVESTELNSGRRPQIVPKSYINLCNGEIFAGADLPKDKQVWAIQHTLTVVTNNYEGLKSLEAAANAFTQGQRKSAGASRVEVSLGSIAPQLKDEKHYEAVEILAYKSALKQFLNPQGDAAKKLLDEIQAEEAYYFATLGVQMMRGLERDAFNSPAPFNAPNRGGSYKVVITDDGNIPMSELRTDTVYSVTYRPVKDLVQVLQELRNPEKPAVIQH